MENSEDLVFGDMEHRELLTCELGSPVRKAPAALLTGPREAAASIKWQCGQWLKIYWNATQFWIQTIKQMFQRTHG